MLELMISKPQASHAMLQEGAERQTLPSKTGFADMLKSSMSGEFRKPLSRAEAAEVLDEELVLGAGLIMPDQAVEKGQVSATGERLGDRTAELRQETRAIRMAHAADQSAQNNASTSKGFSSDSQGQPGREQTSQQQFMNTAQSVVQNAQTVRDQQLGQQFANALNERTIAQGSPSDERFNVSSGVTERRAQLPVGLQSIGLPVSHQKWGQAMGQRVVYMANQQMQQAQITLNPEKLGPVQVRLHVDRDQQVHVVMTAQHGVTREAMDAAIPRLREMFEQAGMNLGSVDVNDQNQFANGEQDESDEQHSAASKNENVDGELETEASNTTTYETDNVVDYYA
ncbi:MAG: flagellar hook-length control protein FliK [Pseudomonadota bacterium]|nr:flagellar hook-length control protein FliK [Pseudomonadota bacterium]